MRICSLLSSSWRILWFLLLALILQPTKCQNEGIASSSRAVLQAAAFSEGFSSRSLQNNNNGDWQAFNDLIYDAVIRFPDSSMSNAGLTLKVKDLRCTNVQISNVAISSNQRSAQQVMVTTTVSGLDMICNARYEFDGWLLVGGSGDLYLESYNNQAILKTSFDSINYNRHPPHDTWIQVCQPTININRLDFSNGGFLGWSLDQLKGLFRGRFETMAEDRFCAELDQMSSESLDTMLNDLSNRLDQYPADIVIDPLEPEDNLLGPATAYQYFIDWQAPDTYPYGLWMDEAWKEMVQYLNQEIVVQPSGQVDMNANYLLREHVLEDGVLVMDVEDHEDKRVFYEGHDQWTQTRIIIDQVRIVGLDTLTTLNPMVHIGQYTLQSKLAWEELSMEVDLTLEIQPSTLQDSYITAGASAGIEEQVTVKFSMAQVEAGFSILLALDQEKLEALQLGHFLDKDQILPCLLTSVYRVELASLSVEALDLEPPQLSGFVSRGLDRFMSNAIEAAFLMYESSMLRASKAFFHLAIREVVNQSIDAQYDSYGQISCTLWDLPSAPGVVDFRDLLLEPEQSNTLGGSGTQRYGNLFSEFVMPTMKEHVLTDDKINSRFIRPFTVAQSGEEGMLVAESPIFVYDEVKQNDHNTSTWLSYLGLERFELRMFDATIRNIDTVASPVELLVPLSTGQSLSNTIRTGNAAGSSRALTFSSRVSLSGQSDRNQGPEMYNELDISLSIPSSLLSFDIFTALNETSLLHFPLKDLTNEFCWLAAMSQDSANSALDLQALVLSLSSFSFDMACISCSSPGTVVLPDILSIIEDAEFYYLVQPYVQEAMAAMAQSAWQNMNSTGMVLDAPRLCPHSPSYVKDAVARDTYGWQSSMSSFPQWSPGSLEAIVATGYISLYSAAVVFATNYLLESPETLETSGATSSGHFFEADETGGLKLLDWTNLSATIGLSADTALADARKYLNGPSPDKGSAQNTTDTGDLLVNAFVRDFFLNEAGILSVPLDNWSFETAGVSFVLREANVAGMDSILNIDALKVLGPRSLQNDIYFNSLNVTVEMEVQTEQISQNISLSFSFHDVAAELSLLLAVDLDKLGNIELGTLLEMSKIIPCLLPGAHQVYILALNVTIGEMDEPMIDGILSPEVRLAVTAVSEGLYTNYAQDLRLAVPAMFDTTLRNALNVKLEEYVLKRDPGLCSMSPAEGFVDFRDLFLPQDVARDLGGLGTEPYGDLFKTLHEILNQELAEEELDGSLTINTLVASWTSEQSDSSGVLSFQGTLLDTNTSLKLGGLDATLGLSLGNLTIINVDSLGSPISVLDPVGAYGLNNTVTFGIGPDPVQLSARIVFALTDGEDMQVRNEVDVNVDLSTVSAFITFLLKIREEAFLTFPLRDVPNVNCWLATVFAPTSDSTDSKDRGIAMKDQAFAVEDLKLNVSCVSCTSPHFGDLVSELYTPADSEEATNTVRKTTGQVLDGDAIQSFLDQLVTDSSQRCPHADGYDANAAELAMENPTKPFDITDFSVRDGRSAYVNIASGVFAAFLLCVLITGKWWTHERNKSWKVTLTEEGLYLLRRQKAKESEEETIVNLYSTSLFHNPHIPEKIRFMVPVVIVLNIALYLGAHLGVLSTVDIDAQLAGEEFTIHKMLTFSFIDSTAKTYKNGGMEMTIMVWLFTGIWPYVKLLASLFLWFAPPQILSVSKRGSMLLWIDTLTKLSIVDIFTMLLSLALFLVYIGGPDEALSSGDLYGMKVIIVPGVSFYCIVVAQRISRVSSRFFLDYHDRAVSAARAAVDRGDIMDIYQRSNIKDVYDSNNDQEEATQGEMWIGEVGKRSRRSISSLCCTVATKADGDDAGPETTGTENYGSCDNEMASVPEERRLDRMPFWRFSFLTGHLGVIFGGLTVVILGIIGSIFAPSIAIEISDLWGLVLESEATYKDAISDYGVFSIVTAILVKARFVLDTAWDYVALGFLLTVGIISIGGVFFINAYRVVRRLLKEGWSTFQSRGTPLYQLPSYLRLYAYKHIEIYVVAVVIGCWQLGAVTIYAIHLYCSILDAVYRLLAYVGLADKPSAECFPIQMSQPDNLLIFLGSFFILLANFGIQSTKQYRKNIKEASDSLHREDHDVERLSTLWNTNSTSSFRRDKPGRSRRTLQLNETAEFSDDEEPSSSSGGSATSARSMNSTSPAVSAHTLGQEDEGTLSTVTLSVQRSKGSEESDQCTKGNHDNEDIE